MKGFVKGIIFALLPMNSVFANCDLTHFRWECDIPLKVRPQQNALSRVVCDNSYGYVSAKDYETMVIYQRADVNMILTINDEYRDSPCIPSRR